MSIAVTANIAPSRSLLLAVCFMCVLACAAGILSASSPDLYWPLRLLILLMSCLCSLFVLLNFLRTRIPVRLDIGGEGEIVLRTAAPLPWGYPLRRPGHSQESYSYHVSLSESSTLWPNFLLLNLLADDGRLHILPILWDSVQPATFRALSVALRWIAVREQSAKPQKGDFL